jgi:ketosteroid isomerase-like protein
VGSAQQPGAIITERIRSEHLGGVYLGVDAVRGWWREWLAAWDLVEADYELIDAGDSVVVLIDQKMRARSSGIEVPFGRYAQVVTLRDKLIVRWKFYLSQAEALKATGVSS